MKPDSDKTPTLIDQEAPDQIFDCQFLIDHLLNTIAQIKCLLNYFNDVTSIAKCNQIMTWQKIGAVGIEDHKNRTRFI